MNLNTASSRPYIKKKHRAHANFHSRGDIKIVGRNTDMYECKECHKILPTTAYTVQKIRSDGAWYLKTICRTCHTILNRQRKLARKNAPLKPNHCDCCHKIKKLTLDHNHLSGKFRGWLCRGCNTGIGALGDNLEGLLQATIYIKKERNEVE
jgi:hypothetical protein